MIIPIPLHAIVCTQLPSWDDCTTPQPTMIEPKSKRMSGSIILSRVEWSGDTTQPKILWCHLIIMPNGVIKCSVLDGWLPNIKPRVLQHHLTTTHHPSPHQHNYQPVSEQMLMRTMRRETLYGREKGRKRDQEPGMLHYHACHLTYHAHLGHPFNRQHQQCQIEDTEHPGLRTSTCLAVLASPACTTTIHLATMPPVNQPIQDASKEVGRAEVKSKEGEGQQELWDAVEHPYPYTSFVLYSLHLSNHN
jgi:hypothetical protein